MANEKITYPKLLACERKIAPSDGIFYGCDWENRYDPAKRVPLTATSLGRTMSSKTA